MNLPLPQRETVNALSKIGIPSAEWQPGIHSTVWQWIECHPETNQSGTLVITERGALRFYRKAGQ